jgi:hypothetical protein
MAGFDEVDPANSCPHYGAAVAGLDKAQGFQTN